MAVAVTPSRLSVPRVDGAAEIDAPSNNASGGRGQTSGLSEDDIARASISLFFRAIAGERFFVAFSTVGSLAVGIVAWRFGDTAPALVAVWCALVCASELALTMLDRRFMRRPPPAAKFRGWAWAKTAITSAHGFAWGLGPILLHRAGEPISTLAPAWAIVIFTAAVVYSCASFLPCVVATIAAALAPAAAWLVLNGSSFDRDVAVCMAVSIPFTCVVGLFAARNMRASVISRLEVASLLAKAEEAQRERARFYSSASHDLRQPVHALGFYVSMLSAVSDDAERRAVERQLEECATSLDRQFNAILGVAEADRAVEGAKPRVFAIQTILDSIVTGIRPEAAAKGLRVRVARSSLVVLADSDHLERVALNLAVNAVRYTAHGGVLIGARRSGDFVRLCVVDTGIGIAAAERDRIFDDFYQVGNRQRARDKGFGLGLSIVRRLCEAMGWHLDLASEEGRGSQFAVSVPAAIAGPRDQPPTAALGRLSPALVVLIVEDDPLVSDATARIVATWGVRVEIAMNGEEALAALARRKPGELWHALLDCRLAVGEDGLDVAKRLRAVAGGPIRITMMSGEVDDAMIERGRALDIPVLRKPMKPMRLRALLSSPFIGLAMGDGERGQGVI